LIFCLFGGVRIELDQTAGPWGENAHDAIAGRAGPAA
jgi:hypothetical protein